LVKHAKKASVLFCFKSLEKCDFSKTNKLNALIFRPSLGGL